MCLPHNGSRRARQCGNVVVEADGDLGEILALGNGSESFGKVGCGGQI